MFKFQKPRLVFGIALIFGFRMIGLFMAIPVISIYAYHLPNATAILAGIALGIYGLTQAIFQLPFGMLSDKIGRKPVIYFGLSIFALGCLVAAFAKSIFMLIIGRALQGAGAIGSTLIATMADFTSEENRSKGMAIIGMTIGFAFILGFIIGPIISFYFGVNTLFLLATLFAVLGIIVCYYVLPKRSPHIHPDSEALLSLIPKVIKNPELIRMDLGILIQHAILSASFTVLPFIFKNTLEISRNEQWLIYLPILLGTFLFALPIIIYAEKRNQLKPCFIAMIALIIIAQACLWAEHQHLTGIVIGLSSYFIAFNVLEAILPSMVSKIAPVIAKGTAMGIYSTAQFFGIFLGAIVAGYLFGHHHVGMVFGFNTILAVLWILAIFGMGSPPQSRSYQLNYERDTISMDEINNKLKDHKGIIDIAIIPEESSVYIKIDKAIFQEADLVLIKNWLHHSTIN